MSDETIIAKIRADAAAQFDVPSHAVRVAVAPYRVCPLGAHVDHQLGLVTSFAIDQAVHLAFIPTKSPEVHLTSQSFPGEVRFALDNIPDKQAGDWGNYVRGAAKALQQKHQLRQGIVGITSGDLAEGGLGSSAAFGTACLLALEAANDLRVCSEENIAYVQAIENNYLGMKIGVLDQAAIILARQGELTAFDCQTHEHRWIAPPRTMKPWSILLAFSGMTKPLLSTDYNKRVDECAMAARTLLVAAGRPEASSVLRNISPAEYAEHRHLLSGVLARRAQHFFTEMERVEQGQSAWQRGDLAEFGRLMTASGASSITNYECGAPPLVTLYELLNSTSGVYGARFSGAGFRGCCVAIVDALHAPAIGKQVIDAYKLRHPEYADRAGTIVCCSNDGAKII